MTAKQDRRIRLREALKLLGVKWNTWYCWRDRGRIRIPIFKEGQTVFLRLSDVDDVIAGRATLLLSAEELAARLGATKTKKGA